MRRILLAVLLSICFALPSQAAPLSQTDPPSHIAPTVSQVAHQIVCDCPDCGKQTVDQCMATCTRGKELAKEIGGQLEQGKSQDQVLEFMGKTHGEQILAIPRQSNFLGRMAPLTPFLILLLGVVPIVYIARTRQRKVKISGPKTAPQNLKSDDDRLDDALKSFDY